jgi:hypothetical protein
VLAREALLRQNNKTIRTKNRKSDQVLKLNIIVKIAAVMMRKMSSIK